MGRNLLLLSLLALLFASAPERAPAEEVSVADSLHKYRFLARTSREKDDFDDAIGYYSECLKYETDSKRRKLALYFLGRMYFKKKDREAAGRFFLQAVELDSLHVQCNLMLYHVFKESRPDTAARALERLLLAKPKDHKNRLKLADFYRRLNRTRAAIPHYVLLAETGRDNVELCALLADLHQDLGEDAQALAWRRRLAGAQGNAKLEDRLETLESVTALEIGTGDVQAACKTLMQLVQLDSLNRFSYYSRIVALAEKAGDREMQLAALEGKVEAAPKDLESLASLVEWHLDKGNKKAAQQWLDRGLRVDSTAAYLQLLQGDLLVQEDREEQAIAAYEKARMDPVWRDIAQQRIWQLRPPETEEEKLKKAFFGGGGQKAK